MSGKETFLGDEIRGDFGDGLRDYVLCLMTTPSMAPTVGRGELLLVERAPARFSPGDILLLPGERPDLPRYAHRLIRIEKSGGRRLAWLKGDYMLHYDAPVPVESALGRAAFVRRADGRWLSFNDASVRSAGRVASLAFRALLRLITEKEVPNRPTRALRACNDLVARWFSRKLERAPAPQLSGR